ncbi:GNAT family N-acetyltransferase [Peribacillus deserti]|uniref:N-acetyltransferase domain-containing protein n=1 Tax=Peribacillus deserti TaxID=673318 RepID=A0A2N5M897_9BACI|nr:GNAT family N-acetyltransferase [Peribacillus deserti]PLT30588.1 hypothetical protein CUU66_07015 [Peribacillus deserti]
MRHNSFWRFRKKHFGGLREVPRSHDTNPVNEPFERLLRKIEFFLHYTIWVEDEIIGGNDIRDLQDERYRIIRIFISIKYQNKGFGTRIMQLIEKEFPLATEWSLDTPHLNKRNHHFYEKLGYMKVGGTPNFR